MKSNRKRALANQRRIVPSLPFVLICHTPFVPICHAAFFLFLGGKGPFCALVAKGACSRYWWEI